jgi:hypothetical protein
MPYGGSVLFFEDLDNRYAQRIQVPEGTLVYDHPDYGIRFIWSGGPYIDLASTFNRHHGSEIEGMPGWYYGDQCINVWDYGKDCAEIPHTHEALVATCVEWLAGQL